MALHPFRQALGSAGLRAFHNESSFKPESEAAVARFEAVRKGLERQVRSGDLTVKVAREKAAAAAAEMKASLGRQARGFSPVPRVFLDRLIDAGNARARAKEHMSSESLLRETNRLLRQTLVEQQLASRAPEFEGKTFVRNLPGGKSGPTLDSLVAFHETAKNAGDEAAMEWARRGLEALRPRVLDEADVTRIDLACDRPEAVNPRLVAGYVEALDGAEPGALERFIDEAVGGRDANACVASFLLAREAPGGTNLRWVRSVLGAVNEFPDAALAALRSFEAEARRSDEEAALSQADYAALRAEAQAALPGLEAPSEDELSRRSRLQSKPVVRLGEPIGLALERRGFDPDQPSEPSSAADEAE